MASINSLIEGTNDIMWNSGAFIRTRRLNRMVEELIEIKQSEDAHQPKKGKWTDQGEFFECSVCHEISCCAGNYCPNCGADMREEETNGTK